MTLVLLHPVALDVECWNLCGLEGERFEYPGNGNRPLPPSGSYTLEELADEVAATYPGMLDLAGVSMGCAVAEYTALRHPDRVRSLFLADGGGSARTSQEEKDRLASGQELPNERAETQERSTMAETLDWALKRWFTQPAIDANIPGVQYVRERWLANDPKGVAQNWRANGKSAVKDLLPTITIPVTVAVGRSDFAGSTTPVENAEALAKVFPNSRFEALDGPHFVHLENPEGFAAAVKRHLAWVESQDKVAAR